MILIHGVRIPDVRAVNRWRYSVDHLARTVIPSSLAVRLSRQSSTRLTRLGDTHADVYSTISTPWPATGLDQCVAIVWRQSCISDRQPIPIALTRGWLDFLRLQIQNRMPPCPMMRQTLVWVKTPHDEWVFRFPDQFRPPAMLSGPSQVNKIGVRFDEHCLFAPVVAWVIFFNSASKFRVLFKFQWRDKILE